LHPIGEIHQLRPTLTYLDILSRKNKRHRTGGGGSDSESDGGPPPDPDEPAPNPVPSPKKEKTLGREAREAQVSARKSNEKGELQPLQGGLSTIRREMLSIIHDEQDESWTGLDYCDEQVCD
jgi:DNA-directed RNA polymerase III subunit RPC5